MASRELDLRYDRRLDLIIMPLLTLGFFCLQLDRGNIANAITDDFMVCTHDLKACSCQNSTNDVTPCA